MKFAMMCLALAAVSAVALCACATTETTKQTYTPQVEVVVRAPRAKSSQANYQTCPEVSKLNGAGGSAK